MAAGRALQVLFVVSVPLNGAFRPHLSKKLESTEKKSQLPCVDFAHPTQEPLRTNVLKGPAADSGLRLTSPAESDDGAALLHLHSLQAQTPTKVEHKGFLQRLQDSAIKFVMGIILIVFSFPVLWFNESRNAKMEVLIGRAQTQCRSISGNTVDSENRDCLVHLQGEPMRSTQKVSDRQFDITFDGNCVALESVVEVYQYIQHEKKEEREKFGGGKDVITTYHYTSEWSSTWHDSSRFEDMSKSNHKPQGLELGHHRTDCSRVECGQAFLLSPDLVSQCSEFVSAEPRLDSYVRTMTGVNFEKQSGGTFYYHMDGNQSRLETKVGDARVRFEYVPDGPVSLLALQVNKLGENRDTFLPFRLVSRGCCGGRSDVEERKALRRLAELSRADLASQAQMGEGCLWCLCCACNLVSMCCGGVLNPEIYDLFHGSKDREQCLQVISDRMRMLVWGLRLLGWLMLFAGLYMLFAPFLTFIKIIPFLGPIISKLGAWLIWIVCFVVTMAVAFTVICLAYLFYHPLKALLYSVIATAIVVVPLALLHAVA